jgi:hypothetical protein
MTMNSSHQPTDTPQQNGYNPITLDDVQRRASSPSSDYIGGLGEPWARWVATPLLGFLFVYAQRVPIAAPLTIVVLLGCLFARMDHHPRQIAGVPLTLAAIKLTFQMGSHMDFSGPHGMPVDFAMDYPGFVWLPMFFAICLVYMPRRDSVTFKIVFAGSSVLLASGLLPGQGFVGVFYVFDTTLFVAIIVGIFLDLKTYMAPQVQNNLRPAL